ncbi:MAG: hypothetical protein V9G23_02925 [Giesbergeria sp.]
MPDAPPMPPVHCLPFLILHRTAFIAPSIRYQAGTALASAGNDPAAIEQWRAATAEAPATSSAYLALVELVNRNLDFDLVDRGYIDLVEGAYQPAIYAYSTFLESADVSDPTLRVGAAGAGRVLHRCGGSRVSLAPA